MKQLFLIRKSVGAASLAAALILSTISSGDASKISSLRIEPHSGSSSYVISKSGALDVRDFVMEDPPRLVLDFIGARHELAQTRFDGDGRFVKSVRSSQFTSEPDQITRVVFDLSGDVGYSVSNEVHAVTVSFFPKNGDPSKRVPKTMASSVPVVADASLGSMVDSKPAWDPAARNQAGQKDKAKATPPAQGDDSKPAWDAKPKAMDVAVPGEAPKPKWVTQNPSASTKKPAQATAASSSRQSLQSFASNTGLVRNKNMTIDVQNAHIRTVLRSMSEFSGVNIIAGPEVEGNVTAHLRDVPWRQALETILRSYGFGWREEYGIIRVSTLDKLTREELELQAAERQKDDLLPLVTEIIQLSYANAGEIKKALKEMTTSRGSIEIEASNNALVVQDIQRFVDKIGAMVEELDRKTKQVEIVAKMVDVDFEASREIGIRWDALNISGTNASAVGDAIIDAGLADPVARFRVGTVQSWGELLFILDMLEKEQKANIISNPRIVTADNREATILVGKQIPLIVSDEAGNPITELTKVGIILRVTPHVNQDNTVTLDLHPEVSELSAQATVQGGVIISLSEADTRVVVGHGETAVIGGLISEVESTLERGVPGLMKIPYLGGLFKSKSTTKKKRELIIFVTPKIVDDMVSN